MIDWAICERLTTRMVIIYGRFDLENEVAASDGGWRKERTPRRLGNLASDPWTSLT